MAKKRLAQYVEYSKKLREQNQLLREQNLAMRKRIESFSKESVKFKETAKALKEQSEKEPEDAEKAPAQTEVKTALETAKSAPVKIEDKQQTPAKTHKVVKGDNLYSLSKKYYGSTRYWTTIRNANKEKLGRNDSVRIGQTIIIPDLKEKKK